MARTGLRGRTARSTPHRRRPLNSAHAAGVIVALVVSLATQGCATRGLSFVRDDRVQIVEPGDNATVELPFKVRWDAESHNGRFAVFFDRTPIRPGQTLRSMVPENDLCRAEPGCPDATWLADRNVYVTDATTLVVEQLPDRRDTNRAKDRHDLTIVYLDAEGHRVSESAFTVEFIVERNS